MTEPNTTTSLKPSSLEFDRENPRLAEYGITKKSSDEEITDILWDAMDVRELVQSISASGFFTHEPLIVSSEADKNRNIVIEGNRRLAAIRLLLGRKADDTRGIPEISKQVRDSLAAIPVIKTTRKEAWRYLGFKHVNGPAKWSSYAKAKYISDIHSNYRVSLEDIAKQIGDGHRTVQRLYRGLMVIEQAEKERVYDREDRYNQRFAFSHLYTGLDYDGVSEFLDLKPETQETASPVPKKKLNELGELCVWLYGSKKKETPPLIQSQNPDLRQLDAALRSREAVAALRSGSTLSKAFEISRPASSVFEEALIAAKRELSTARAHLTTGYDKSEALLRIAGSIAEVADDIYEEMERKRSPGRKPRMTEN